MSKRFQDKIAIVTGASAGIGRATALQLAREGATVVLTARASERLDAAARQITADGGRAVAMAGDGRLPADANAVVERALKEFGRIDILVNGIGGANIGEKSSQHLEEVSFADYQALLDFNLSPMFLFTTAVIPVMKRQREGKIVHIASIAAHGNSIMSSGAYVIAKAGIVGLTRKMARQLAPWNIHVNATNPTLTLTEGTQAGWDRFDDEGHAALLSHIPMGRLPTVENQASVICFLCSAESDFVTGANIDVAGGQ